MHMQTPILAESNATINLVILISVTCIYYDLRNKKYIHNLQTNIARRGTGMDPFPVGSKVSTN